MTNQNNQNDKPNTTAPQQDQPRQGAQQGQQQRQGGQQTGKPADQSDESSPNRDIKSGQDNKPNR